MLQSEAVSPSLSVPLSALEKTREAARLQLHKIAVGEVEGDASQMAALRLLLKDELEPETERNLYAGRSVEELAERSLVLAVSVLGLVKVAAQLRELAKAGTLDLGLDWEPPKVAQIEAVAERVTETVTPALDDSAAGETAEKAVTPSAAVSVDRSGVETLDG